MLLEVEDLHAGYGESEVLSGVSCTVSAREIVAVVGRNGVGKTTLMRSLAGLLPARQGNIRLVGEDVTRAEPHNRARLGIGYVPQGREIFPKLTVGENLLVGAYATNRSHVVVEEALTEFPSLKKKLKAFGGSLSGGQQQLLALARALVAAPKVLLLDEPSEGIQPSILDEIADAVRRLRDARGLSVLLVEQNMDFASSMADRAYLMGTGAMKREVDIGLLAQDEDLHREFLGA